MNTQHNRTKLIIALIITSMSILLLAMSLRAQPPRDDEALMELWSYLFNQMGQGDMFGASGTADMPYGVWIVDVVRTIYFIALISFPISVALAMVDKEMRKRIITTTIVLAVLIAVLAYFYQQPEMEDLEYELTGGLPVAQEEFTFDDSGFDYEPTESPNWLVWIVSIIIAVGLSVGILLTIRYLRRRNTPTTLDIETLALPVSQAMQELERGANFDETILKCYAGMMRTVEAYRGLRKGDTITATEFIESLLKAGLPEQAVLDLTRLFERVRYGQHNVSPQDEERAIHSLRSIALRLEEATHE